jgi:hypothetical protein
MTKSKRIPSWYKLFIERRIKRLEKSVEYIDLATRYLDAGFPMTSLSFIRKARESLK